MKRTILIAFLFAFALSTSAATATYTTRSGDTLKSVADRYGMTVEQLAAANPYAKLLSRQTLTVTVPDPTPTPTPDPTPTAGVLPNVGFNVFHDQPSTSDALKQLAILKSAGVTHVRPYYNGQNDPVMKTFVMLAKNAGFSVIAGADHGTISSSYLPTYTTGILAQAKWAQDNGIEQMSLGNEQEYRLSGITQAQWASYLRGLATQVKAVYSGKISYEASGDHADFWATQTLGDIDLLGLNVYCGYSCNKNYLQKNIDKHGVAKVYVAESNCDMPYVSSCKTDSGHATQIQSDFLKLAKEYPNTKFYYFAFGADGGMGVPTSWGLYNNATLMQPLTAQALGL